MAEPTDTPVSEATETAEPTDTPVSEATETAEPTDTPTATPGASSFASWPTFMRNNEHWGHQPDVRAPHESVSVDWSRQFDQDQINATAVLADGTLYVGAGGAGDSDGSVHALDPVTGETKWSIDTGAPVTSAAAVDGGFVYFGTSNGSLYALQADDGSELWSEQFRSTGAFTAPVVVDGSLYIGSTNSRVYEFDMLNGEQQWNQDTFGAITSSPVVSDGMLYAPSGDNDLYAYTTSGSLEWQVSFDGSVNGVSYRQRRIYATTESNELAQVNTSGSVDWRTGFEDGIGSTPAVTENRVVVGTRNNTLYAVNRTNGTEIWRFTEPSGGVNAPPAVADGTVYLGSRDGSVYAVDLETGDEEWSFETENNIEEAAPVVAGGRVYIGSQDGTFYALSE
jgi:outer membrane protein assembly factor BamB